MGGFPCRVIPLSNKGTREGTFLRDSMLAPNIQESSDYATMNSSVLVMFRRSPPASVQTTMSSIRAPHWSAM